MVPSYPVRIVILVFVLCPSEHASSHLGYCIGRRWSHFYSSFCDGCDGRLVRPMVLTRGSHLGLFRLGCTHTTVRLMVLTMGFSGGWLSFPDSQLCLAPFPSPVGCVCAGHSCAYAGHSYAGHSCVCVHLGGVPWRWSFVDWCSRATVTAIRNLLFYFFSLSLKTCQSLVLCYIDSV